MRRLPLVLLACVILMLTAPTLLAQGTAQLTLLSAYYGLDNGIPAQVNLTLCRGGGGQDGMPVIFSQVIDPATLQTEDFAVTTAAGVVATPNCAILEPAIDPGELRTVLLVGEFGNAETDPPITVEVVGEILTGDASGQSFIGASVEVTPLSAGPSLIIAESLPFAQWRLDQPSGRRQGDGCPSERTLQAVRATWAGGVSNSEGDEAGDAERALYRVTVRLPDGSETEVTPFALADLGDGDNNHLLCLDVRGEPLSVSFPAGHLLDPNEDTLNPETSVDVVIYPDSAPMQARNVRYCEVVPTYRRGITLVTQIWNTLGLNDCPADAWAALDAAALQAELGALNVKLNGPRYWVLDEIGAVGGVTASGERAVFGTIEMQLRAVLETRIGGDLVGAQLYTPNTVQRDTRYVFYAGELIYALTDLNGNVYIMQSYAQIIEPELTIDDLETLGERLTLPEGWTYAAVRLEADFILLSGGETTVLQDDFLNTYQRSVSGLPAANA
ncbi:MAG: hypothetical protein SF123_12125 [Chloroflexota bacterium]|nr:hypothetical protein [Chloroflexota bacterium]